MHYAILSLLAGAAIGEYVITGRLSFGAVALLYVVLRLQADRAAALYVKYGKEGPPPPPWATMEDLGGPGEWVHEADAKPKKPAVDPEIKVAPLGAKGKQKQYYGPRATEEPGAKANAPAKVLPFREKPRAAPSPPRTAAKPFAPAPETSASPEFAEPRFHGAPHEVLGVSREAGTKVILRAFRHWIMQHHPDHVSPAMSVSAGDKARRLHEAKNSLLKARRKQGSKAASA